MEIKVSPGVKSRVFPALFAFIRTVLYSERLSDWTTHIWLCRCEGVCESDTKIICLGLCETQTKTELLFLHEVAHALRDGIDAADSYWHRGSWTKELLRLCKRYLDGPERSAEELRAVFV